VRGWSGDDLIEGRGGADTIFGGEGVDTASYQSSFEGVSVNLVPQAGNDFAWGAGGHAQGDNLFEIENLTGSAFADRLTGDAENNVLKGEGGNDTLLGGEGADTLEGGSNNDWLYGNDGNDKLFGGSGLDTLNGNSGQDTLEGGSGNDTLNGGADYDWLYGDAGDDQIAGGANGDNLRGGLGNDTFIFNSIADSNAATGRDLIMQFNAWKSSSVPNAERDRLNVSSIDANQTSGFLSSGDQAFEFIGAVQFTRVGQVRVTTQIDSEGFQYQLVEGNVDSYLGTDFSFYVYTQNNASLIAGDFIL
jgi:Ca2+-binding RTX toxin-like protein